MPSQRVIKYAAARGMTPEELSPEEYKRARGHGGTPEHGGTLTGTPKTISLPGRTVRSMYSDMRAEQVINKAAEHGNRVQIKVHSATTGQWSTAGGARGYSASYAAREIANAGGIREAVGASFGAATGDNYDLPEEDDIDAWQIDELEV